MRCDSIQAAGICSYSKLNPPGHNRSSFFVPALPQISRKFLCRVLHGDCGRTSLLVRIVAAAGVFRRRCPSSCEPFTPRSQTWNALFVGSFAGSAASLLSPSRVARISRLIGNFDSTAKERRWQGGAVNQKRSKVTSQRAATSALVWMRIQNETPPLGWRFAILQRSLASRAGLAGG